MDGCRRVLGASRRQFALCRIGSTAKEFVPDGFQALILLLYGGAAFVSSSSEGTANFVSLSFRHLLILAILALFTAPTRGEGDAPIQFPRSAEERIQFALDAAQLGDKVQLSLFVADARTKRQIIDIGSTQPMIPASLLKIVTSAAALEMLGPEKRFITFVDARGEIEDGVLSGTLRLRGGGDPGLGPRFQRDRTATTQVLKTLAQDLKDRGIRKVTGGLIVDDSMFTGRRFGLGWPRRERAEWYCAEVGALNFNDNTIDIEFKAGKKGGAKTEVRVSPPTEYVNFVNSVRTVDRERPEMGVRFYRSDTGKEIVGRGILLAGSTKTEYASVEDPGIYSGAVFVETMEKEGIKFEGRVRRAREKEPNDDLEWMILARQYSAPVSELLPVVLNISQNLYAEVLLRHVAIASGKEASFEGGAEALAEWVKKKGFRDNGFGVSDGSGLSRADRVPPSLLADVLMHVASGPHAALFRSSLAAPGDAGSLNKRFTIAERNELRGRLRAKTGYIDGVHGLAGYLKGEQGGEYVFVICLNNVNASPEAGRRFVEELTMMLARAEFMP